MIYWFIFFWLGNLIVGGAIGNLRGRTGEGLLLAFVLGPLGWLITLLLGDKRPKCLYCNEAIIEGAIVCKHCGKSQNPGEYLAKLRARRKEAVEDPVDRWEREQRAQGEKTR